MIWGIANMGLKILATYMPFKERHKAELQAAAPDAEFLYVPVGELTREIVAEADIIIGNAPAKLIAGTEKLKWIQLNSAGADGYTAPGVLPEHAKLTNSTGAYGLAISEHMLAMLLMLMKRLHQYRDNQSEHLWRDEGQVVSVEGATALIVGLGDIGGTFAKRLHEMGAYTIGIRRKDTRKPDYLDELALSDALPELLPRADIVAVTLPGGQATYKLFDANMLARCKQGAYFINVGRGSVVDTDALAEALSSGHLAGVGVDVTDPEPLPPEHPLWGLQNAVITPHISGFFHLEETLNRIIHNAAENLRRFQRGETLNNEVDFETGYRRLV